MKLQGFRGGSRVAHQSEGPRAQFTKEREGRLLPAPLVIDDVGEIRAQNVLRLLERCKERLERQQILRDQGVDPRPSSDSMLAQPVDQEERLQQMVLVNTWGKSTHHAPCTWGAWCVLLPRGQKHATCTAHHPKQSVE